MRVICLKFICVPSEFFGVTFVDYFVRNIELRRDANIRFTRFEEITQRASSTFGVLNEAVGREAIDTLSQCR